MDWTARFKTPGSRRMFWLVTYGILLYCGVTHLNVVIRALEWCVTLLTPLLVAVLFVFLLNPPMKFIEKRLFLGPAERAKKPRVRQRLEKMARPVSLVLAILLMLTVVSGVVALVLPTCVRSVRTLVSEFSGNLDAFIAGVEALQEAIPFELDIFTMVDEWMGETLDEVGTYIKSVLPQILNITLDVTGGVVNTFLGLILSIYILSSKERHARQLCMVAEAFFSDRTADRLKALGRFTADTFENYVIGQFAEALLLGALCFVGMTVLGLPYAPLISTVVGVTNMIPIVGPLLGVIPGALIILVIEPISALWFLIFVLVLQQVENNLIYPRVVGTRMGLSGIWILLAVTIGSALGLVGVLLAVPTMTVIYRVASDGIRARLEMKKAARQAAEG